MTYLSDDTFEPFLSDVFNNNVIDLRDINFMDPYGMVGILETGRHCSLNRMKKKLLLPDSGDVLRYLERMDFFRYADRYFQIEPAKPDIQDKYLRSLNSDVLLEITPIEKSDDIHFIVDKVKHRAHTILETHLHYNEMAVHGFIVALSEVCQNIIEHSENSGFVGIQKYRFQRLDKNVVKIAVMDLGVGFRKSLGKRFSVMDDCDALEKVLLHGASRFTDEGRGHGLAGVRRFIKKWNGKFTIRSGTARFSIIPSWGWGKEREKDLFFFPGSQINIMLPEI
jgi:anti-sigma regulatory factor (Ser/Thr protein kinase)